MSRRQKLVATWKSKGAAAGRWVLDKVGGWAIVTSLALLASSGVLGILALRARDLLNADLRVWHGFLALMVSLLAGTVVGVWGRQRFVAQKGWRFRRVRHLGVDWVVDKSSSPNAVCGPFCPADGTFLAHRLHSGSLDVRDPHFERERRQYLPDGDLDFACLKCNGTFELNGHGDMRTVWNALRSLTEDARSVPRTEA